MEILPYEVVRAEVEKYDWDEERDAIDMPEEKINEMILKPLGIGPCAARTWLQNPGDAMWVNKVFRLDIPDRESLVLKVSHPFWNGCGKCLAEVKALKLVAAYGIPCPSVIHYFSPIIPEIVNLPVEERARHRRREHSDKTVEYEWILMTYVSGDNLATKWETISWEERKIWIENIIFYLSRLSRKIYPVAGNFVGDSLEIIGPFLPIPAPLFARGPLKYWIEKHIPDLTFILNQLSAPNYPVSASSEKLRHSLNHIVENYGKYKCFTGVPVVFCLSDVAPKNLLVDLKNKEILAFFDMEWAAPNFLGVDIMEMDYPLSEDDGSSNESFTDSLEVPYLVQSKFVMECWEKYEVKVPYIEVQKIISKIVNKLFNIFEPPREGKEPSGEENDDVKFNKFVEELNQIKNNYFFLI